MKEIFIEYLWVFQAISITVVALIIMKHYNYIKSKAYLEKVIEKYQDKNALIKEFGPKATEQILKKMEKEGVSFPLDKSVD